MSVRLRRGRLVGVVVLCAPLFAACGSQVPPCAVGRVEGWSSCGSSASQVGNNSTLGGNGGIGGVNGGGSSLAAGGAGGTGGAGSNGGTSGGTGGGGTGGGGGTSGGTGGGSTGGGSGGGTLGLAGVRAASCAGFKNGPGITNSTITIANASDLSGAVNGLFQSAQKAVMAYVAYFNSTSSICGRKLQVEPLDSGESEPGDQQAATTACGNAFAMVGSMGAFDGGGASTVTGCGIPDLRAATTETARYKSPVTFGTYSLAVPEVPTVPFEYFKQIGGNAYKNAAFVYLDAGAASLNAQSFMAAEKQMGYDFKDQIAIAVDGIPDYNGYALRMKNDGIQYVQYIGAYQYAQKLRSAMAQQGYNPIWVMDPTGYDPGYVATGSAVNNTYVFISGPLFEEASRNPQLQLYTTWLQRTAGGAPTFFGTYAWAAAALFTQLAIGLGGQLSRSTLLAAIRNVHNYTDGGMVPPQDVGGKHTPKCFSVIQLQNGNWVRKTPYPYTCGSTINSGIGD